MTSQLRSMVAGMQNGSQSSVANTSSKLANDHFWPLGAHIHAIGTVTHN